MLEKASRFGGHLPLIGFGQIAPLINVLPDSVNDGVGIVLLLLSGNALVVLEGEDVLLGVGGLTALFRFGDRGYESRTAPGFGNFVRGLAVAVKLPVAA